MRWFIVLVAGGLFVFSTVVRVLSGLPVDGNLSFLIATIAGLVFGGELADWIKNKL